MTGQKELPELGQSGSCQELRFLWAVLPFSNNQNNNLRVQGSVIITRTQRKREATGRSQAYPEPYMVFDAPFAHLHPYELPFNSFPFSSSRLVASVPILQIESLALLFGLPTTDHNHSLPLFQDTFSPFLSKGMLPEAARQVTSENKKQLSCCTAIPIMNSSQPVIALKLVTRQSLDQQTL